MSREDVNIKGLEGVQRRLKDGKEGCPSLPFRTIYQPS